jgi:hypothetical protein
LPKLRRYRRLKEITIFAAVARWKMCESRNFGNMPDVRGNTRATQRFDR